MAKEVVIKENGVVRVSIDVNRGYIIRLKKYSGATFTVTLDMNIEIGQSSRMYYDFDSWQLILQELEEGKKYMTKVKLSGSFPKSVTNGGSPTIKPSQYIENSLYQDVKGRMIFYIGKASEVGGFGNRVGCDYLYGILDEVKDIKEVNGVIHIFCGNFRFDSYTNKPSKLVKHFTSFNRNINYIQNHTEWGTFSYKFNRLM